MKNGDSDGNTLWHKIAHRAGHYALHYGHMAYFLAVSIEGSGVYAALAGCLFLVTLLTSFIGEE